MGHNNGITLLELSLPFRLIDQFSGLPGTGYDAYFKENQLIYGTNYGLFSETWNGKSGVRISSISGGIGQVYQITEIQNFLLSAQNDGAFHIQNGSVKAIDDPKESGISSH